MLFLRTYVENPDKNVLKNGGHDNELNLDEGGQSVLRLGVCDSVTCQTGAEVSSLRQFESIKGGDVSPQMVGEKRSLEVESSRNKTRKIDIKFISTREEKVDLDTLTYLIRLILSNEQYGTTAPDWLVSEDPYDGRLMTRDTCVAVVQPSELKML